MFRAIPTPFSCLLLNPSCRSFISQFCLKVKLVRASRDSGRLVTLAAPFLFIAAYAVSLFFLGFNIEVFSLSLIWPVAAVFWVLASRYESGLAVPGTVLAMSMLLYWGWQAVTLLWSPVPFVSTTMFWWLSALPLAFWLYLLLPRERHWPRYAIPILLSGLGLAFTGAYQLLIAGKTPDSLFLDVNTHAALLNLIALPACGYLLVLLSGSRAGIRSAMLMGLSFFILTYGILLTRSRGGTLSFLVCTGILLAMALRHVPRRIVVIPAGLIALAYLLADLSWAGGLTERAGTLSDIREAGAGRFVIWSQSWLMLFEHSPFRGIGLGIYSILWPPYRVPQDDSAGFFVHNDYLQIWIEAGLPGLLLFLALLGGALWTTVRILGNAHLPRAVRLETAGLGMGLAAIALHSLVQYNFYIVSILFLYGLGLARLQELEMAYAVSRPRVWLVQPAKYFSAQGYRAIVLLAALLPLGYLASIGISAYQLSRGVAQERTDEAEHALIVAHRFWPDTDAPLFMRADLYRLVLAQSAGEGTVLRQKVLFDAADELLDKAERRNPFRPHTFALRAELYRMTPAFVGPSWREKIEQAYRQAIRLDPRFYQARYGYASYLLLSQGEVGKALEILETGMRYPYRDTDQLVPYLTLTADLRERTGDARGAAELRRRIDSYRKSRERPPGG